MFDRAIFSLQGIRAAFAISCAFALVRALAVVGEAFGLSCAVVGVWEGAPLLDQAGWVALFFVSFVARQGAASVLNDRMERYAHRCASSLRNDLLSAVFRLGPQVVQRRGSAAVAATTLDGIGNVENYIALAVVKTVAVVVVPLALLIAVFLLDWVSGVIALACYPFVILYMAMIGYTAKDDAARRRGEFELMSNHFIDSLRGMDTLRAFGRSREQSDRVFASSERFRAITMKTLRIAQLSGAVLDIFATLALAAVAIMLGFRLVDGSLAFFPALAVLVMVPEYFRPLREFAADYHATLDGKTALAAVREIVSEAEARKEEEASDRTLGGLDGLASSSGAAAGGAAFPQAGRPPRLVLDNVGFSYGEGSALSGVSLSVEAPCKVGIVGASGSGKSTLLSILAGFADPCAGSARVGSDGDASTLRCPAWHARAAFIPQDPYLFHASIRDNIAFYRPDASEEDVLLAVRAAGLDEFVSAMPAGLDTLIGEGSRALSGGQAQRVALARAFADPSRDVLLFDEPTAHLDIETEMDLKQQMLPLMQGKLVFFATHRLHWLADMDYVLIMHAGRCVWQGPARDVSRTAALRAVAGEGERAI